MNLLKIASITPLLLLNVDGTIINASNLSSFDTTTEAPILDNTGNLLQSGVVGVGLFAPGTDFSSANVLSNFNQFAGDVVVSGDAQGASGGFFQDAMFQQPTGDSADFINQTAFVVVGDGNTLANSTALAIFETTNQFQPDSPAGLEGTGPALASLAGNVVRGEVLTGDRVIGFTFGGPNTSDFTFPSAVQLTPLVLIPEPSTSILGLIAGIGFLSRRNRK